MAKRTQRIIVAWLLVLTAVIVVLGFVQPRSVTKAPIQKIIVISPTTTTQRDFLGIRCVVSGYEVRTDVKSARDVGCK